ncbi:MAG TPA: hypothetical protein P5186_11275 [Candidatus Paceibacterota bacterium]|nr:hypothetical protein [Candidatus Paceibacterota bacterium]
MKPESTALAALCAVIDHDLRAMEQMDKTLCGFIEANQRPDIEFRDLAATAYLLHNLYNALENTFSQISRTFENHVTDAARWHRELLGKMFLEIPGVRPAVLPPTLRRFANNLRGFRHLFRHSYDFELDAARLKSLLEEWLRGKSELFDALSKFLAYLRQQIELTQQGG